MQSGPELAKLLKVLLLTGFRSGTALSELLGSEPLRHVEASLVEQLSTEFLQELAPGAHLDDGELL